MLTTRTLGLIAAAVTTLCLSAGLAPEVWAQAQPAAATDTAPEVSAALDLLARGAWSPSKTYVKDDLVTSRGSAWRAKRANRNKVPGSTLPSTAQDWERFAAGFNPLGAWLGSKTYHRDDLVLRQGSTWRALRTNLNKPPGAFPADWQQFAAMGAAGGNSVANGTAGAPSINFSSDPNTGIFSPSSGKIALVEDGALFLHNIGSANTALGLNALDSNSGNFNTAIGQDVLTGNTTGNSNTGVGRNALQTNSAGFNNTALGGSALSANSTGSSNTALGFNALSNNGTGGSNTGVGINTLMFNSAGNNNIAIGDNAGSNTGTVSNSIFIGNSGASGDNDTIKIGTTQTRAFIAGIVGATVLDASDVPVLIDANGKLGTTISSRRYKEDIQPMGEVSAALLKLRPVTFRYKQPFANGGKPIQYGLIAEEVAEVLPELAVFNKDGTPETVKYHLLPSLLLNEVQGQHKTIARQETTIRSQAEQIAALERRLSSLEAMLAKSGAAPRAASLVQAER